MWDVALVSDGATIFHGGKPVNCHGLQQLISCWSDTTFGEIHLPLDIPGIGDVVVGDLRSFGCYTIGKPLVCICEMLHGSVGPRFDWGCGLANVEDWLTKLFEPGSSWATLPPRQLVEVAKDVQVVVVLVLHQFLLLFILPQTNHCSQRSQSTADVEPGGLKYGLHQDLDRFCLVPFA